MNRNIFNVNGQPIIGYQGIGGAGTSLSTLTSTTALNTEITATEDALLCAAYNATPGAGGLITLYINGTAFYLFGGTYSSNLQGTVFIPVLKGTKVKASKNSAITVHSISLIFYQYN